MKRIKKNRVKRYRGYFRDIINPQKVRMNTIALYALKFSKLDYKKQFLILRSRKINGFEMISRFIMYGVKFRHEKVITKCRKRYKKYNR